MVDLLSSSANRIQKNTLFFAQEQRVYLFYLQKIDKITAEVASQSRIDDLDSPQSYKVDHFRI